MKRIVLDLSEREYHALTVAANAHGQPDPARFLRHYLDGKLNDNTLGAGPTAPRREVMTFGRNLHIAMQTVARQRGLRLAVFISRTMADVPDVKRNMQ